MSKQNHNTENTRYATTWHVEISMILNFYYQLCQHHGAEFVEYKCRYCCSLAVFFCFGTTHFCNRCHDDAGRLRRTPPERLAKCPAGPTSIALGSEQCPLKVDHPPSGEEFVLGCAMCRNIQSFWYLFHGFFVSSTGRKVKTTIFDKKEKRQRITAGGNICHLNIVCCLAVCPFPQLYNTCWNFFARMFCKGIWSPADWPVVVGVGEWQGKNSGSLGLSGLFSSGVCDYRDQVYPSIDRVFWEASASV